MIYKKQEPDPSRESDRGPWLANIAKEIQGHVKMLNFAGASNAHGFVMVGFVALFGTLVIAYV